jgi:hypothetical protein
LASFRKITTAIISVSSASILAHCGMIALYNTDIGRAALFGGYKALKLNVLFAVVRVSPVDLVAAERDHWINSSGAAGGQVAGCHRDSYEEDAGG